MTVTDKAKDIPSDNHSRLFIYINSVFIYTRPFILTLFLFSQISIDKFQNGHHPAILGSFIFAFPPFSGSARFYIIWRDCSCFCFLMPCSDTLNQWSIRDMCVYNVRGMHEIFILAIPHLYTNNINKTGHDAATDRTRITERSMHTIHFVRISDGDESVERESRHKWVS